MKKRSAEEMVAYALEIDPALLAFVPELLTDLDELGSDAESIVKVLEQLELPQSSTVVDLGCGKGAVAVEIADELDCDVVGIELFEPFISACRDAAEKLGVSDLCRFLHGDILSMTNAVEPADVAVYAALGDVLGSWEETVGIIRQYVKPGGFLLISDAFIKDGGSSSYPGFENYANRDETISRLTVHGDILRYELLESEDTDPGSGNQCDREEADLIYQRAVAIAKAHPELEADLLGFAKGQVEENSYIDENLIGAIWVLQRAN